MKLPRRGEEHGETGDGRELRGAGGAPAALGKVTQQYSMFLSDCRV